MLGISSPGEVIERRLIGEVMGGNKVEDETEGKWREQAKHK